MIRTLLLLPLLLLATLLPARLAQACSRTPPPSVAFPGTGAVDVSPRSSIFVRGGYEPLQNLTLEANGQPVPIGSMEALGSGWSGTWLKVTAELAPLTTYVLRGTDRSMPVELTRFTTAGSPGASPGVAPRLETLRLFRVQYPTRLVGAGGCVQSQVEGYIDVGFQPGTMPDTPPSEIIYTASLTPKAGGAAQRHVFLGNEPALKVIFEAAPGDQSRLFPSPASTTWRPQLEPGGEFCVTLTVQGRNDRAFAPLTSQPLCAKVNNLEFPDATGDAAPDADGGCSMGHGRSAGGLALLLAVLVPVRVRSKRRQQ